MQMRINFSRFTDDRKFIFQLINRWTDTRMRKKAILTKISWLGAMSSVIFTQMLISVPTTYTCDFQLRREILKFLIHKSSPPHRIYARYNTTFPPHIYTSNSCCSTENKQERHVGKIENLAVKWNYRLVWFYEWNKKNFA